MMKCLEPYLILYQKEDEFNKRVDYVEQRLNKDDIKWLHCELKKTKKREKLRTEIHFLYKFARAGFSISMPIWTDVIAVKNSTKYTIEVYQPDVSRYERLRNRERKAKIYYFEKDVFGNEYIWKGYNFPFSSGEFLKEMVNNCIKEKKKKRQLIKDESSINILCIDLSDRTQTERPSIINPKILDYYNLSDFKTLFDKWDALNGVIVSIWANTILTEKIGLLINKDIDKERINILKQVIQIRRVI